MADEELLDGDEEQKDPEAEQNQEQDSAQEQAPESEASESAEKAPEEQQGEVAVDQEKPEQEQEADQPQQESEGESSEDESVDDLVEQQMLAELEKLESEEEAGGEAGAGQAMDTGAEEEVEQDVQRPEFPSFGQTTSASEQKNLDLLLDVNLPISIELGRTSMKIKEILSLGPGSVVELKKLAGEPVDLLVNNKIVAKGEVVVVDENFGLRITSLLSPEERLRSLE
ncbi:MAG: flagellar motor switch protein FliN [candidate division Zixibacteria bacterium]|nr:flagellar motor switch protein FliN [candidate division Zixibacteria bacterium]